jgi:putative heme-binding domain-containing protein
MPDPLLLFPSVLAALMGGPAEPHRVPENFVIEKVAGEPDVVFPMFAAFDERGRLYVAESSGGDLYAELSSLARRCRVRRLEDADGDGRFERSLVFAESLVFPMGLAWKDGRLYVADPPDLVALEDLDGDGRADRRTVITSGFGHRDNGSLHGLLFGPDGLLYMTMGEPDGYRLPRGDGTFLEGSAGALLRCRPDGSRPEVICGGFVNLVEVVFLPGGGILGSVNWFQRPAGGLRDALVHLTPGGLYPLHGGKGTPLPDGGEWLPAVSVLPAVAVSGLVQYRGRAFPQSHHGNLFSAQHNSRKIGRHVLESQGSTWRSLDLDFVTSDDPDFHPSDVVEAADGSLLVIDTGGWYVQHCPTGRIRASYASGGIYRVRHREAPRLDDPWGLALDWERAAAGDLVRRLEDPRPAVRDRAQGALAAGGEAAAGALEEALRSSGAARPEASRWLEPAAWALGAIPGETAAAALRRMLGAKQVEPAAAAARALGLREDAGAEPLLAALLGAGAPQLQLAASEALASCGSAASLPAVVKALAARPDRFLEHALLRVLDRVAQPEDLERLLAHPHPRVEKGALILAARRGAIGAPALVERVASADRELRGTALRLLEGHPEGTAAAAGLLRRWLEEAPRGAAEEAALCDLLVALSPAAEIAELGALVLSGRAPTGGAARRDLLLRSLARVTAPALPRAWVDELAKVLDDPAAELRALALRAAASLPETAALRRLESPLERLAASAAEGSELRLGALRLLARLRPALSPEAFDLLLSHAASDAPPLERLASAEALARAPLDGGRLLRILGALSADPLVTPGLFLPALGRAFSGGDAGALLDRLEIEMEAGWEPAAREWEDLVSRLPAGERARGERRLEKLRAAEEARSGRLAELEALLEGGDPLRGRAAFFRREVACGACHRVGDEGGEVGPDLTRIGAVRSGRDILEAIIFPSASFAQGYEPYLVVAADGRTASGMLLEAGAELVAIRDAGGAELRFRRDAVQELRRQRMSLMPEGLERALPAEELRDLLAFLLSLR